MLSNENQYPLEAEPQAVFEPSVEQLERAQRHRRYEWLTLYVPLIFMGLLVVLAIVGGIWGTTAGFGNEVNRWRITVSAMADIIVIAVTLSMTVACLILPILGFGGWIYGRQQGWKPWQTTRHFLWRVDQGLTKIQEPIKERSDQVVEVVIKSRSRWAYFETIWRWIRYLFTGK